MQTRCHLSVLIREQARKYKERTAITFRDFGGEKWKGVSWNTFSQRVEKVSNALLCLGVKPQENIAVFSQNCLDYLCTDFGVYGIRAVCVPFYATSSEHQIRHIINETQVQFIFVGEQDQYDKAHRVFALCPSLERIIIYDHSVRISTHDPNALYFNEFMALGDGLPHQAELEELYKQANDDDMCDILYTSGTTGESKGVTLTYGQWHAAMRANDKCVPLDEKDRVMNFLPYTHIFERACTYFAITKGCQLIVNTNPKDILRSMRETRPTSMCSVPRFWEKVYVEVNKHVDNVSPSIRKAFRQALAVGKRHNIDYLSRGKRPPMALWLKYKFYNKAVLSIVRKQLGLGNPNIFPTAGAAVSVRVEEFTHSIGINMIVGYGLTESLATVSCDHLGESYTIGSVGRPIDGIQIKIGENNEIMLKGATITKGYYKREDLNATAFDTEGYFHTGDAGYMKNGELFLTERIKDLFKTSNGKYIAPQTIEALLLVDKYIDQVAVVADGKPFVTALIVPEFRVVEEWARDNDIAFETREDLCDSRKIQEMMLDRIQTLLQQLAPFEQIRRISLLAHHFSVEDGELTNTLKLRRGVIYDNYKVLIDRMYKG